MKQKLTISEIEAKLKDIQVYAQSRNLSREMIEHFVTHNDLRKIVPVIFHRFDTPDKADTSNVALAAMGHARIRKDLIALLELRKVLITPKFTQEYSKARRLKKARKVVNAEMSESQVSLESSSVLNLLKYSKARRLKKARKVENAEIIESQVSLLTSLYSERCSELQGSEGLKEEENRNIKYSDGQVSRIRMLEAELDRNFENVSDSVGYQIPFWPAAPLNVKKKREMNVWESEGIRLKKRHKTDLLDRRTRWSVITDYEPPDGHEGNRRKVLNLARGLYNGAVLDDDLKNIEQFRSVFHDKLLEGPAKQQDDERGKKEVGFCLDL